MNRFQAIKIGFEDKIKGDRLMKMNHRPIYQIPENLKTMKEIIQKHYSEILNQFGMFGNMDGHVAAKACARITLEHSIEQLKALAWTMEWHIGYQAKDYCNVKISELQKQLSEL